MTLTLRRADSPFTPEWARDKFWTVICEDTTVGSIVLQSPSHGDEAPWGWSITMFSVASRLIAKHGREATRDAAMAAFRCAWDIYRPEIGDGGWRKHLDHCAWLDAQAARSHRRPEEPVR